MEKGVSKYWTPGKELEYEERLKGCGTFAERHLIMFTRDLLKYDGRSKQAKRALAQTRLRLAMASDKDLEELARIEASMRYKGEIPGLAELQILSELEESQAEIRKKGIKKEQLECR